MGGTEMDNQRSVFLVWVGCYSDMQVIAVFETRDAAESLVEKLNDELKEQKDWMEPRVEEMELSRIVPELHTYICLMDNEGNIINVARNTSEPVVSAKPEYSVKGMYGNSPWRCFSAYGTTREHAIKNCADYRRAMLAQPDFTIGG